MKIMQIKVEFNPGESFQNAFLDALRLAINYETEVVGDFNSHRFLVNSKVSFADAYEDYHKLKEK